MPWMPRPRTRAEYSDRARWTSLAVAVTGLDLAGRDAFLVKLDDPFVGLDVDDTSWE
jgi:hypothetical protein